MISPARASTTGAANISQRFAVVDGCAYLFQFSFQVSKTEIYNDTLTPNSEESLSPPRWELDWLDTRGGVLRLDSEAIEFSTRSAPGAVAKLSQLEEPTPWFYQTLLKTPAGAASAELRFVHPFPKEYALILEQVSFTPTVATLRNGNFGQWQNYSSARLPVGWTVISGWVDEERNSQGAILRGNTSEDTILVQTTEVTPLQRYELQIDAYPLSSPTDNPQQQHSRIELHFWGIPVVIIPLVNRGFPTHTWVGTAPLGATTAEIRLIQPQGNGDLLVESVSLSRADVVSVPLILLSEAPGELTVSDLRVTYDLPELPTPRKSALQRRSSPATPLSKAAGQPPVIQPVVNEPIQPALTQPFTVSELEIISSPTEVDLPSQSLETDEPPEASVISEASTSTPDIYIQEALEASILSENHTKNNSDFTENISSTAATDSVNNLYTSAISDDYSDYIRDYPDKHSNTREKISFPVPSSERHPPRTPRPRKKRRVRGIIRLLKILFRKLRRLLSSLARRLFSFTHIFHHSQ